MLNSNSKRNLLAYFIVFLIGVTVSSFVWYNLNIAKIKDISAKVKPLRQQTNPYLYINPLLGYDLPSEIKEFNEYKPIESQISKKVTAMQLQGVSSYSVYFRDLSLGRWVGINENSSYAPASMMKVVIMIAYYKKAENDSKILNTKLTYSSSTAEEIAEIPYQSPSGLTVGSGYTIEELIESMIINSDNGAKNALLDNLEKSNLDDVYTDLGLPNPSKIDNYQISPKQYSLLLRILYNSTYLSRTFSEKSLSIMSKANFSEGLSAGLPGDIKISQKFGQHVDVPSTGLAQTTLSDCGVIYHKSHPYILCVMTKGYDISELTKAISGISEIVWQQVNLYADSKTN